jgi:Ca2+-binding EF-hand superfamily protein
MLLQPQAPPAGQDLPSSDSSAATATATQTTAATPTPATSADQFATDTLSSLLSAQEAPPSPADVAQQVISAVDTNSDGELSLSEIENALGANGASSPTGATTSLSADALSQAFSSIDTNGDGEISASELTNALAAQNGSQDTQALQQQGPQGAHHHHAHHAHGGGGSASGASSIDLADELIGSTDTNGDGTLSLSEIENALGTSASSTASSDLTSAFNSLDTNSDGQLSASELSTGIDAFRAAHHMGGAASAAQTQSTQTVSA